MANTDVWASFSAKAETAIQLGPKLTRGLVPEVNLKLVARQLEESEEVLTEALQVQTWSSSLQGWVEDLVLRVLHQSSLVLPKPGALTVKCCDRPFGLEAFKRQPSHYWHWHLPGRSSGLTHARLAGVSHWLPVGLHRTRFNNTGLFI